MIYGISDNSTINNNDLGYTIDNRPFRHRCRSFFIETVLEKNRNKKKALLQHYKTLREDVLDRWIQNEAELDSKLNTSPESIIPLYVHISENLRSKYFNRLRSHLKTSYKEIDNIITDIDDNEIKHNQRVASFLNGFRQRIKNAVYTKDDCNLGGITEHKFASDATPLFVLDHIINYYIEKFSRSDDELVVRKLNSHYQLYRASDTKEMGRGDQQSMECLKKKLDALENDIMKVLNELSDEGNRLIKRYNLELKSKATDLIVQIEDGYLFGECEFESNQ